MTVLIIIIGVILAAILIGSVICLDCDDGVTADDWVRNNLIDKDIL